MLVGLTKDSITLVVYVYEQSYLVLFFLTKMYM